MLVPVLIAVGVLVAILYFSQSGQAAVTNCMAGCQMNCCEITNDPSTWPTGDRVWDVCRAIAIAEGANIAGSNPDRLNNPGDISDGAVTFGSEFHSGSLVTTFPDKQTGWKWLYSKIKSDFVDGTSHVYSPDMTWRQVAQKYAGNWQDWLNNVTRQLGISATDRVGDYFA